MPSGRRGRRDARRLIWIIHFACLSLILGGFSGCGGCQWTQQAQQDPTKKKKPPKPKPDFDRLKVAVQPSDANPPAIAKPGHWTSAQLRTRANNFNFHGELDAAVVDREGRPLELDRTPFRLATSRPVVLTKGRERAFDVSFFIPHGGSNSRLSCQLRDRRTATEVKQETELLSHMASYQYYFYVLARSAGRYRYISRLDSVRLPGDVSVSSGGEEHYYRVVTPVVRRPLPLPSQAVAWTSIAYVLWDNVGPDSLHRAQQEAMLDWLHWGGQLIISGPQTLDALETSFLGPYLPAKSLGTTSLLSADVAALSKQWTIANSSGNRQPLDVINPWLAVKLEKHPAANYLPGADGLLAERRVGRGRIVVSAFRLDQRELLNWPSFDGFFNACLLRRDRRRFVETSDLAVMVGWADRPLERLDSRHTTRLRLFSRDGGSGTDASLAPGGASAADAELNRIAAVQPRVVPAPQAAPGSTTPQVQVVPAQPGVNVPPTIGAQLQPGPQTDPYQDLQLSMEASQRAANQPGAAGWNDFSAASEASRKSIRDAAGIDVPRSNFVLKVLGIYLLVIVPINWLVFWTIGRVELAWVAAPVISILCAITVIWLAQLDIGFARSSTDLSVLELYADHSRAHVTRYTALYTSLSTTYEVQFEEPSAVAQPFPTGADFRMLTGDSGSTVVYRRDNKIRLTNLDISSNSTGMVHSEYLRDLGGTLRWQPAERFKLPHLINDTQHTFTEVGLVRRGGAESPGLEAAWIGNLKPGANVAVDFSWKGEKPLEKMRALSPLTAPNSRRGTLSLRDLVDLASRFTELEAGQVRLVGCLADEIGGVEIVPSAAQHRGAALVVANLHFAPLAAPQPDVNLRTTPALSDDDGVGVESFDAEMDPDMTGD